LEETIGNLGFTRLLLAVVAFGICVCVCVCVWVCECVCVSYVFHSHTHTHTHTRTSMLHTHTHTHTHTHLWRCGWLRVRGCTWYHDREAMPSFQTICDHVQSVHTFSKVSALVYFPQKVTVDRIFSFFFFLFDNVYLAVGAILRFGPALGNVCCQMFVKNTNIKRGVKPEKKQDVQRV